MSRKEAGWGNSFLPFTTSCRVSVCLKPSTLSSISYTKNLICHCEEGPFGCCGGRQNSCKGCKWLQAELWRGLPGQPLQGISELLIALLVQNHLQQWGQRLKCFALQLAEAKGNESCRDWVLVPGHETSQRLHSAKVTASDVSAAKPVIVVEPNMPRYASQGT